MRISAKSGCPVIGHRVVNSGQLKRTLLFVFFFLDDTYYERCEREHYNLVKGLADNLREHQ